MPEYMPTDIHRICTKELNNEFGLINPHDPRRGPELSSFNILLRSELYLFLCSSEAGPVCAFVFRST